MDKFSQKSLNSLSPDSEKRFYVYGLIDPRTGKIFYIGKGENQRVFDHEKQKIKNEDKKHLKLDTINDIHSSKLEVTKVLFNTNLSEDEAFAAEAALINAFNFVGDLKLTNIVSGHGSKETLTVDEYEKWHGAEELLHKDIKHNILFVKVGNYYTPNMNKKDTYDRIRGIWGVSLDSVKKVDYVCGVYNSLIVGVYKPAEWFVCKDAPDGVPSWITTWREDGNENRKYFIDNDFETVDDNKKLYLGKSVESIKKLKCESSFVYLEHLK